MTIKLWNMSKRREEFIFTGHSKGASSISYSLDLSWLAIGQWDNTIKVLNFNNKNEQFILSGHTDSVISICFSSDTKLLASASDDKLIKVWNLIEKKEEFTLVGHSYSVRSLCFMNNSRWLASGSDDMTIKVWNIIEKREEFTLAGHKDSIISLCFSPDEKYIASGSRDKLIKVWNFNEMQENFTLIGHSGSINSLCFLLNSKFLVSGSNDNLIKVWDISEKRELYSFPIQSDSSPPIIYSQDISKIKLISSSILELSLPTIDEGQTFTGSSYSYLCLSFSPDSASVALGMKEGIIKICNIMNRSESFSIKHSAEVTSLSYSHNLISYTSENTVNVINLETQTQRLIGTHSCTIDSVCTSPNSNWLITKSSDNVAKLWDLNGQIPITLNKAREEFTSVTFSKDSEWVVAGSRYGSIRVWKLNQIIGVEEQTADISFERHSGKVNSVFCSYDGKLIVSGSDDQSIKLWNVDEKREEFTFEGHEGPINSVCCSVDSTWIVSGSSDMMIKVWNINEKRIEFTLIGHTHEVISVCLNENMKYVASLSSDNSIKIWNVNLDFICNKSKEEALEDINADSTFDAKFFEKSQVANVISMINSSRYENILLDSTNISITDKSYTPFHFAALEGKTDAFNKWFKEFKETEQQAVFKADCFGKSPLYYSINKQHQKVTDLILSYVAEILDDSSGTSFQISTLLAFREDISLIIKNSSVNACDFLNNSFYSNDKDHYGNAVQTIAFCDGFQPNYEFFTNTDQEKVQEHLRVKSSIFKLPSKVGSLESLEYMNALLNCTEKNIFKVQLIKKFIQARWNMTKIWVVLYSSLAWFNLTLIIITVNTQDLISAILLLFVTFMFILWETLQLLADKSGYLSNFWNWLDVFRIVSTTIWAFFVILSSDWSNVGVFEELLTTTVVSLGLIRGLTSFRVFDNTRYYIRLILESVQKIGSFLVIFFYTTFGFGLLSFVANGSTEMSFKTLWIDSFNLSLDIPEKMKSDEFGLVYTIFFLAFMINVIIMLNMIISILGDSFDEFQVLAVYYDCREMVEVILEIEQIFSMFRMIGEKKYLQICVNYYKEEDNIWQGKVIDMRDELLRNNDIIIDQFKERTNNICGKIVSVDVKVEQIETSINRSISQVENKVCNIEGFVEQVESNLNRSISQVEAKIDDKINGVQKQIESFESKIKLVQENADEKMREIQQNLKTILLLLEKKE